MKINQLLVGRKKLKPRTRIDQLEPSYLANVVVLENVIIFVSLTLLILPIRQIGPVRIQTEHASRFNL